MILIIPADTSNGSVEFPKNETPPKEFYEVYVDEINFYFFFTKEERDLFYDERGIPHD